MDQEGKEIVSRLENWSEEDCLTSVVDSSITWFFPI